MSHLGVMLFWGCVQITLVGTTALVACLLLRGCQARARSRVLQITFVLMLGLSLLTFSPWPRWPSGMLAEGVSARAIETDMPTTGNQAMTPPTSISPGTAVNPDTPTRPVSRSRIRLHAALTLLRSVSNSPVPGILTAVILVGFVIGACRCVVAVLAIRREVQAARLVTDAPLLTLLGQLRADLGCRRLVAVVETDRLTTAATVGWRNPVILLPVDWRSWSADERRAVFAHELAHIVRLDFASLAIAQISAVLHFYHPLVHWLGARLQLEQELVADAMAAHVMGDRDAYLTVLARMALRKEDRPMGWPARSFLPTRETILRRVEMLTESRHRTGKVRTSLAAASLAAVVVVGVLAAGLRSRDANAQLRPPALSNKRPVESAEDLPTSRRNLQSLGLAMHGYHQDHGHFPPAVVAGKEGQTHSWRVALLPYLGQQELYEQYQLGEPWDSESNLKVLKQIPSVYRAPQDDENSSRTSYFVFTGEGTPFCDSEGVRMKDFKDGTSNTILVVEVKLDVPWTKPDDIDYPVAKSDDKFTGWYADRLMALLGDGSARGFPIKLEKKVTTALIEISDGATIDWSQIPNLTK